jgi:hypothetical protein
MPTPADGMAAGRPEDSRGGVALEDGQQQAVQARLRQHESVRVCRAEFDGDAEASLTTDNVPKTATRATRESRRW